MSRVYRAPEVTPMSIAAMSQSIAAVATLTRKLRPPGALRRTPIDPLQEIAELRRRDRHGAVNRCRPDEAPTLEPLAEQAHAPPSCQRNFHQMLTLATEGEKLAAIGIAFASPGPARPGHRGLYACRYGRLPARPRHQREPGSSLLQCFDQTRQR